MNKSTTLMEKRSKLPGLLIGIGLGFLSLSVQASTWSQTPVSDLLLTPPLGSQFKIERVAPEGSSSFGSPENEEGLIQVTCSPISRAEWRPYTVYAFSEGYKRYEINADGEVLLPSGTYDFVAFFNHVSSASYYGTDYDGLVILESVDINQAITLDFDPALATNRIKFQPLLSDGTELELKKVSYDDSWIESLVSEGNFPLSDVSIVYSMGTEDWNFETSITTSATIMETPYGTTNPEWYLELYTNTVSDRIHFGITGIFSGVEETNPGTFILGAEQTGLGTAVISNNPDTWSELTLTGGWTSIGENTLNLIDQYGLSVNPYGLRVLISGGEVLNTHSASSFGYSGSMNVSFSNDNGPESYVKVMVAPTITEVYRDGWEFKGIMNIGGFVWLKGNDLEELACVPMHGLPYTYLNLKGLNSVVPGCEAFTAPMEEVYDQNFTTSPALFALIYDSYYSVDDTYYPCFYLDYKGRLGEYRYTDRIFASCEGKLNGEVVGNNLDELNNWLAYIPENVSGELEIRLIDNNCTIDGNEAGNEAAIKVNLDNEDVYPPSLTMLQFRNNEGAVTSSFESGEVRLSASDINFSREEGTFVVDSPSIVRCEVAPAGSEEYIEIELSEEPQSWTDAIFGSNYQGAIQGGDSYGWYDLKVTVEDAAGNVQTQIVKMAFELKEGIEDAVKRLEECAVSGIAGIYRMDGVRMSAGELPSGMYIIRDLDGSVRKVQITK